jgi:hypothetical protein
MPGQAISGSHADEHGGDLSADRRIVGYSASPGAYCYSPKPSYASNVTGPGRIQSRAASVR